MINQDRELLALIEDAKNGSMDSYESACDLIYEEVYRLVALVYDKEENRNKLVKYIFNKMYNSLKKYNANKDDIHRWINIFAIVTMYRVYSQQKGDIFQYNEDGADYEYNYIEDDERLAESVAFYNEAIANGNFRKDDTSFGKLTKAQIIIYELYCYACCTVDEIEDLLEIDSIYICSEIISLKRKLTNVYFVSDTEERTPAKSAAVTKNYSDYDDDDNEDNDDDSNDVEYDDDDDDNESSSIVDKFFAMLPEGVSPKMVGVVAGAVAVVIILAVVAVIVSKDKPASNNNPSYNSSTRPSIGNQVQTQSQKETGSMNGTQESSSSEENSSSQENSSAEQNSTQSGNNNNGGNSNNNSNSGGNNNNNSGNNNSGNNNSGNTNNSGSSSSGNNEPTTNQAPVETPTEGGETPTEGDAPTEGGDTPTEGTDTPTEGGDVPTEGTDTPTEGGDAPTEGTDTPTEGGDTPAGGEDTPSEGGDEPAVEGGETPAES